MHFVIKYFAKQTHENRKDITLYYYNIDFCFNWLYGTCTVHTIMPTINYNEDYSNMIQM